MCKTEEKEVMEQSIQEKSHFTIIEPFKVDGLCKNTLKPKIITKNYQFPDTIKTTKVVIIRNLYCWREKFVLISLTNISD